MTVIDSCPPLYGSRTAAHPSPRPDGSDSSKCIVGTFTREPSASRSGWSLVRDGGMRNFQSACRCSALARTSSVFATIDPVGKSSSIFCLVATQALTAARAASGSLEMSSRANAAP